MEMDTDIQDYIQKMDPFQLASGHVQGKDNEEVFLHECSSALREFPSFYTNCKNFTAKLHLEVPTSTSRLLNFLSLWLVWVLRNTVSSLLFSNVFLNNDS